MSATDGSDTPEKSLPTQSDDGRHRPTMSDMLGPKRWGSQGLDLYDHPYVRRLETQVEKLEMKYEAQVRRTEEIQISNQKQLIELQRMTTIGQSKTLADFMLKAKNLFVGGSPDELANSHEIEREEGSI